MKPRTLAFILASICLILLCALSALGATVTGSLQDSFGVDYAPYLRFTPRSTPLANGVKTTLDIPRGVTPATNGNFSVNLVGGFYDVDAGAPNKPIRIFVRLNDTGTYTFNDCAQLAVNAGMFAAPNLIITYGTNGGGQPMAAGSNVTVRASGTTNIFSADVSHEEVEAMGMTAHTEIQAGLGALNASLLTSIAPLATTNRVDDATNGLNTVIQTQIASKDASAPFTIIQLPDLQYGTSDINGGRVALSNTVSWIISQKSALNVKLVLGGGDLVDNATVDANWDWLTNQVWRLRDAGIPFLSSVGNHDVSPSIYPQGYTNWNKYFPVTYFTSETNWSNVEFMDSTNSANLAFTQTNSGLKLLFVSCADNGFGVPWGAQLAWASNMVSKYSDHVAVIVTHSYLSSNGEISMPGDNWYRFGDYMWERVVKPSPSVGMVLCGHDGELAQWVRRSDVGAEGNIVQEILFDTQWTPGTQSPAAYGGVNWARVYTYLPSQNQIVAKTWENVGKTYVSTNDAAFTIPIRATRTVAARQVQENTTTNNSGLAFWAPFLEKAGSSTTRDQGPAKWEASVVWPPASLVTTDVGTVGNVFQAGSAGFVFGTTPGLAGLREFSAMAYVKVPANPNTSLALSRFDSGTTGEWFIGFLTGINDPGGSMTNATLRVGWVTGTNAARLNFDTPITWDATAYHLLGLTYKFPTLSVYVDGQSVLRTNVGYCATNAVMNTVVGGNTSNGLCAVGYYTDARIYTRALSRTEVATLHSSLRATDRWALQAMPNREVSSLYVNDLHATNSLYVSNNIVAKSIHLPLTNATLAVDANGKVCAAGINNLWVWTNDVGPAPTTIAASTNHTNPNLNVGYNIDAEWNFINSSDMGAFFGVEGDYLDASLGHKVMEIYAQFQYGPGVPGPTNTYRRGWMTKFDKQTQAISGTLVSGGGQEGLSLNINDGRGTAQELISGKQMVYINTNAVTVTPPATFQAGATVQNQLYVPTGAGQFTTALQVPASTHATSRRAGLMLGDWLVSQDSNGTGWRNFTVYGGTSPSVKFDIQPGGETTVYSRLTAGVTTNTTPSFKSVGTNNVVLKCPDGGSFILRVGNDGTLNVVTNTANL